MNFVDRSQVPRFPSFRHRSAGFIVAGFSVATVVSTGLFWIMYQLISTLQVEPPLEVSPPGLRFHAIKRTIEEPPKRTPKPIMPPIAQLPMPAKGPDWSKGGGVTGFEFRPPDSGFLFGKNGNQKTGITEREYMPLTEIQPRYPEKALLRNIQGTCVVLYTITKTGSVTDLRVDESRCTSALFHAPSLRAASKFKYSPRIVDGEEREATSVARLFRFSIIE